MFSKISQNWQQKTRVGREDSSFSVIFAKFPRTPFLLNTSDGCFFQASGFTEAVMQMNFWITHNLAHLSILSSSWHFCVYLRQAQVFCCIATASLTLDILYYFWQRRIEITWYLNQPISFCENLYRNNHRVTSILLSLGSIGLMKLEI